MLQTHGRYGVDLLYREKPWLENIISKNRVDLVTIKRLDADFLGKKSGGDYFGSWERILFITKDGKPFSEVGYRGNPSKMSLLRTIFVLWGNFYDTAGAALGRMSEHARANVGYILLIHSSSSVSLKLRKSPKECSIAAFFASTEARLKEKIAQ